MKFWSLLNRVPFRGELVGIDAEPHLMFGKAPHGLDRRKPLLAATY
jgi:penicillin-binding protein 1C